MSSLLRLVPVLSCVAVFLCLDPAAASADVPVLPLIQATSTPSATASPGGAVHVFVRGEDNALWWTTRSADSWTEWTSLGGALSSAPDCASPVSGLIACAARGPDGGMWVKTATVTGNGVLWGDWQAQGGALSSGPSLAAVVLSSGNIELQAFVRGPGDALWAKRHNGTVWGNWFVTPNIAAFQDDPDCTWRGLGEFDCVVRGAEDSVRHNDGCCLNTAGATWEDLGGEPVSGPSIASRGPNSLDVFIQVAAGQLWWRHSLGGRWGMWVEIEVPLIVASGPDCAATSADVVFCAFLSPTGTVQSLDLFLG